MVSSSTSRSRVSHSRPISKHRHKSAHGTRSETEVRRHRRRKSSTADDNSSHSFVHVTERPKTRSSVIEVSERRREDDVSDADEDGVMSAVSEESRLESEPRPKERKVKITYVQSERPIFSRRTSTRVASDGKTSRDDVKISTISLRRSNTASSRKLRSHSAQDIRESKPIIKRSHSLSQSHLSKNSYYEPSLNSKAAGKRASFFGIFTPTIVEEKPPRLVECLTCLSDDIPIAKSAKLKCGHRMCHSCLKRIFKLSVNDPQHMPPRCCTSNHIPLKHVDNLFDVTFKKLWNKKFQEYTTKNRIYCPSRRCGEWIKPGNIHSEGGKKFGKCGRCKTKVCCLCNGKWHGNKDCPKDEETNALLETAKQSGWQRCYNCRTMVELKEGCNHMTCRCRAEFCMICGLKWKSCNCPWFNYDQVENDRLEHMRVPVDIIGGDDRNIDIGIPAIAGDFGRPPRPRFYRDEIRVRRRQELLDEELARRLQILGVDDDDDHNGPVGNRDGIGNAWDRFMNEELRRPANADPPVRHRAVQEIPAPMRRSAETPILRRPGIDYAGDAARHAPVSAAGSRRRDRPPRPAPAPAPAPAAEARPSVLAGLGGTGRGSGRVGAWRSHVEPGVVPAEGVLSM